MNQSDRSDVSKEQKPLCSILGYTDVKRAVERFQYTILDGKKLGHHLSLMRMGLDLSPISYRREISNMQLTNVLRGSTLKFQYTILVSSGGYPLTGSVHSRV